MTKDIGVCICCGKRFIRDRRVKGQKYCSNKRCQRLRRALWQRNKMREDADYKDNQKRCQKEWLLKRPGYYKEYRRKHPEKAERNRFLQIGRDARRRKNGLDQLLAKMDSIGNRLYRRNGGIFKLIPRNNELLAKMDVMTVELIPVQRDMNAQKTYNCLQNRTR